LRLIVCQHIRLTILLLLAVVGAVAILLLVEGSGVQVAVVQVVIYQQR
jgi:hypothetical protein